jgi:hypothetical protein
MKNGPKSYSFNIIKTIIALMKNIPHLIALLLIFNSPAFAGMPDGPYIVFADLSKNSEQKISSILKSYMDSDRQGKFCEEISRNPIIFLKKRPNGLDNAILQKAIIKKDKASINSIQKTLTQYQMPPDIQDGLDGVIVYDESNGPAMLSIGLRSKKIRIFKIQNTDNSESVIDAFCTVIPPTLRN